MRAIPFLVLCLALLAPDSAMAYVGPGAGLSLLGALWALLAAVGTAVFFLVAWPVRRMMRRRKQAQGHAAAKPGEPQRPAPEQREGQPSSAP
jgi:hypothetical protein